MSRSSAELRSGAAGWAIRLRIAPVALVAILAGLPLAMSVEVPVGVASAEAAHPFYERRLVEGTRALEQERPREAARLLEIAAFGLLDEPPRLAEALVRLALAQADLDKPAAFRETVHRIAEIEERFEAYRQADLSAAERSALDHRITELTPASELDRSPSLQRLLSAPAESESATDETETTPAETAEAGDDAAPATPVPFSPVPELTPAERQRVERAREILSRARQARELDEALTLARPVADDHPTRTDLQQLVGEIAYRSSRWEESARYLKKGLAPVLGSDRSSRFSRPELLFYLAVALYESGRPEEAAAPLELALPQLELTPFVQSYVEKILPPSPSDGP